MKIYKVTDTGKFDITPVISNAVWSGEKTQGCRTLDFSYGKGFGVPDPRIDIMNGIELIESGESIFYGYVIDRSGSTDSNTVDITCKDRGFWLKKNKGSYSFAGYTPEAITQKVCYDFGIDTGFLAPTSISVTKYFYGTDLYSIIMTAYTKAAQQLGKQYYIRFTGQRLNVFEKGAEDSVALKIGKNIITAAVNVSIEKAISRVAIYSSEDKFVQNVDNADLIKLMGVAQEYVKQTKGDNKLKEAYKKLRDNGIEQKITVTNLGNIKCITGRKIYVEDPEAGIVGGFYIDADTHTWKNGVYTNKLSLKLENLMDENDSGKDKK